MKRHRHRWRYLGGRYGGGYRCSNCNLLRVPSAAPAGGWDYLSVPPHDEPLLLLEGARKAPTACSGY